MRQEIYRISLFRNSRKEIASYAKSSELLLWLQWFDVINLLDFALFAREAPIASVDVVRLLAGQEQRLCCRVVE